MGGKSLSINLKCLNFSPLRTDSDIGKAGEEVIKDTEGARELSGNFRLILWSSQSMRKEGRISRPEFMAALSDVMDDILDLLERGTFLIIVVLFCSKLGDVNCKCTFPHPENLKFPPRRFFVFCGPLASLASFSHLECCNQCGHGP